MNGDGADDVAVGPPGNDVETVKGEGADDVAVGPPGNDVESVSGEGADDVVVGPPGNDQGDVKPPENEVGTGLPGDVEVEVLSVDPPYGMSELVRMPTDVVVNGEALVVVVTLIVFELAEPTSEVERDESMTNLDSM